MCPQVSKVGDGDNEWKERETHYGDGRQKEGYDFPTHGGIVSSRAGYRQRDSTQRGDAITRPGTEGNRPPRASRSRSIQRLVIEGDDIAIAGLCGWPGGP